MFGIALSTILTHAAAVAAGGVIGTWLHGRWITFKAAAQAEEASLKDRVAALEAAVKGQAPAAPKSTS
jgi:hypothetical protein